MRNVAVLIVVFLFAQVQGQNITQGEFFHLLIDHHPIFEKEKLTTDIEREEQLALSGVQDWNILSSVNLHYEKPALNYAGPDRMTHFSASGGIKKVFWKTGGQLSASYSTGYYDLDLDPAYNIPNSLYLNQVEVEYRHPLLRNKGGFLDRLSYNLKQYDIDFAHVKSLEGLENFLTQAGEKYLEWVFLEEQVTINKERLRLSKEEVDRTQKMYQAHLIDKVDVLRAENAVRSAEQQVLLAESQRNALQAELAELTQQNNLYQSQPDYDLYGTLQIVPLDTALLRINKESRLMQPLIIRLGQLRLKKLGFMESGKPDLSVFTRLRMEEIKNNYGKALGMNKPYATVGLQLSFPLEKTTVKHKILKTDEQITQLNKTLENIQVELRTALSRIYVHMTDLKNVLRLNQEQIESAAQKTAEELKLYQHGRGELTFVIQSRDEEQAAKLVYAQNAWLYHKLALHYKSLLDEIYTEQKIITSSF